MPTCAQTPAPARMAASSPSQRPPAKLAERGWFPPPGAAEDHRGLSAPFRRDRLDHAGRSPVSGPVETLEFQAEARQLLNLMVHSIYSNKDIFLRELISNASDALDKLRLEAFLDKELEVDTSDLHVDIAVDQQERTLTVRDNGIGMTRDEVVHLIGTIAKSGTAEFLRKLKEQKDAAASQDLIGQFGVGFYSSFMVADRVTLLTRRPGEHHGTRWESTGEGTYTIPSVQAPPQGTPVTPHLH